MSNGTLHLLHTGFQLSLTSGTSITPIPSLCSSFISLSVAVPYMGHHVRQPLLSDILKQKDP